uniref:MMPL family transporter n=1 Tax=Streptomyces coelicoflavus TaxID=285562 RepID=UPI0035ABEC63
MATFLYRPGRTAVRRRWLVTLLWVVVLGGAGLYAAKAPAASDDGTSFMPGIEAQKAFDLIAERFPGSDANGANARTVFIAQGGEKVTADENQAAIGELASTVAEGAQVDSAVDPFTAHTVSKDASTAYAKVSYKANGQLQDQG